MAKKKTKKDIKAIYRRDEMFEKNVALLKKRGVTVDAIAEITHKQQSRYIKDVPYSLCVESVEKMLSYRDTFHYIHLGITIDMFCEEGKFPQPIQDIIKSDIGMFGVDEIVGLDIAGTFGTIGQTNFGDIDVNKPGIVGILNEAGKEEGICHTFLDDIVGAIAAAASTRVAQIMNEGKAGDSTYGKTTLFNQKD